MDVIYESLLSKLKEIGIYCIPDDIVAIETPSIYEEQFSYKLHFVGGESVKIFTTNISDGFLNDFIKYKEYLRDSKLNI